MRAAIRTVQERWRAGALACVLVGGALAAPARAATPPDGAPLWAPLPRAPLDPPLVVTGDFGEYRTGHFHGGLDFSTGHVKGRPVYACMDGEIVRVRSSGVGYGRSIYLQTVDGRLLVYGHLDAYAEPLASYVEAARESSGQYEQDVWPAAGTFRVKTGQRLGWTGDSGAGGPHFHFEIRRADMAYNPPRAGLAWDDAIAPRLDAVWLEPLDDSSYVERSPAPRRFALGARPDTAVVEGRVRAVLDDFDPSSGGDPMAPWRSEVEWQGAVTACSFDSVSWADGMPEIDYVYDRGRATDRPRRAIAPWASAGFRPRVLRTGIPESREAGTLTVHAGDPPRVATFRARDLAGHVTERTLVLRPPRAGEVRPRAVAAVPPGAEARDDAGSATFDHEPLPYPFVRVRCAGVPKDARAAWFERGQRRWPAARDGERWTAVVSIQGAPASASLRIVVQRAGGGTWVAEDPAHVPDAGLRLSQPAEPPLDLAAVASAGFERFALLVGGPAAPLPSELRRVGAGWVLGPTLEPLKQAFELSLAAPLEDTTARVGFYQDDGSGWSWVAAKRTGSTFAASTRRLGAFALAIDETPPAVALRRAPQQARRVPYSRWALEAHASDGGSGIDARASYFLVDGKRVPTEWDPEASVLRWKPLARPAKGSHEWEVVATDRAGNERRVRGRFMLD